LALSLFGRLLKNAPAYRRQASAALTLRAGPSSLRRTRKYVSAGSPTRRRGKKSLLIRRDATLRILGALHPGIFEQPAKDDFFMLTARNLPLVREIQEPQQVFRWYSWIDLTKRPSFVRCPIFQSQGSLASVSDHIPLLISTNGSRSSKGPAFIL